MANERFLGMAVVAAAVGAGVAVLGPALARAFRPALRTALARGMVLARTSQVAIEGAWEDFEDFLAEARAEADMTATATKAEAHAEAGGRPSTAKRGARADNQPAKVTPLRKDKPRRGETGEPPHEP
jgi:hypothetical protein